MASEIPLLIISGIHFSSEFPELSYCTSFNRQGDKLPPFEGNARVFFHFLFPPVFGFGRRDAIWKTLRVPRDGLPPFWKITNHNIIVSSLGRE